MNRILSVLIMLGAALSITQLCKATEPDISPSEYQEIINDLAKHDKVEVSGYFNYVPSATTTRNIRQLLVNPQLLRESHKIRKAAFFAAGATGGLTYTKPSDTMRLIQSIAPTEFEQAAGRYRSNEFWLHLDFNSHDVGGPYPGWTDESSTFFAMLHCMPRGVWFEQEKDALFNDNHMYKMVSVNASGSGGHPILDFKYCVEDLASRAIYQLHDALYKTEKGREQIKLLIADYTQHIKKVLSNSFYNYLSKEECTITGPDDCLLSLMQWTEMSPDDPRIAAIIKKYESEPEFLSKAILNHNNNRLLVFKHSKLASMIHAPDAWSDLDVKNEVTDLIQLDDKYIKFDGAGQYSAFFYEVWGNVMDLATDPKRAEILFSIFEPYDKASTCAATARDMLQSSSVSNLLYLTYLKNNEKFPACSTLTWQILATGKGEFDEKSRSLVVDIINNTNSGVIRDDLVRRIVNFDGSCMSKEEESHWAYDLCHKYTPLPLERRLISSDSNHDLDLTPQKKFNVYHFSVEKNNHEEITNYNEDLFLQQLSIGANNDVVNKLKDMFSYIYDNNGHITNIDIWKHPHHSRAIARIHSEEKGKESYLQGHVHYLLITPHELVNLTIPTDFDTAHENKFENNELLYVSDIDSDGNLELWFSKNEHECKHDQTDLERDIQCNLTTMKIGEVDHDIVTSFIDNNLTKVIPPSNESFNDPKLTYAVPQEPKQEGSHYETEQPCNLELIKNRFRDEDGLFTLGDETYNDDDFVDYACKTHPKNPDQTIFAFFTHTDDATHTNDDQEKYLLTVALIDLKKKSVKGMFTSEYEEDGTTRISDNSIHIDTARYNLSSSIRAFGIRLHIGYSPRYAEGGDDNYLSLFIESGNQLKRVLADYTTESWHIVEDDDGKCFDSENGCEYARTNSYISIAPSMTNGLHDLIVTSVTSPDCDENCTNQHNETSTTKLIYNKTGYSEIISQKNK